MQNAWYFVTRKTNQERLPENQDYSRYGVRSGVNVYLTANRPEEATALANGKKIARPGESKLSCLECSMLPRDYGK